MTEDREFVEALLSAWDGHPNVMLPGTARTAGVVAALVRAQLRPADPPAPAVQHMSAKTIDLRGEFPVSASPALLKAGEEVQPYAPSANLAKLLESLRTGKLGKLEVLAQKIERGDATEDEEELNTLYESLAHLIDVIHDLTGMCRRREEALHDLGVRFPS